MAARFLFLVLILYFFVGTSVQNLEDDILEQESRADNRTLKSLSRKRRYLLFPEGSSFQLVFCLTYPSVGGGAIFVYGATAALAWELPSDPMFFQMKKELLKGKKKQPPPPSPPPPKMPAPDDHMSWNTWQPPTGQDDHQDAYGAAPPAGDWMTSPARRSYHDPFLLAGRKYGEWGGRGKSQTYDGSARYQPQGYARQNSNNRKDPIRSYLHPVYHEIHRRTRRELYEKIEKLFTALSKDGKACLLKAICEVSRAPKGKGTFMEEIIKAIFRSRPHGNYQNEDVYDEAADSPHNCDRMYPTCTGSIWNSMFMMNNKSG